MSQVFLLTIKAHQNEMLDVVDFSGTDSNRIKAHQNDVLDVVDFSGTESNRMVEGIQTHQTGLNLERHKQVSSKT